MGYRLQPNISASDLFGGRLEAVNIREHSCEVTDDVNRVLTDGHNYLQVHLYDGWVGDFSRYAPSDDPGKVLNAIAGATMSPSCRSMSLNFGGTTRRKSGTPRWTRSQRNIGKNSRWSF
jgi:hypothetical protein